MSRVGSRATAAAAAILASAIVAACGSASPGSSTPAASSGAGSSQAQQTGLSFARCMRRHGVPSFPDPGANGGGVDLGNIPGINTSAPAFTAARRDCNGLLPVKHVPTTPPTAQAFARLLHWAVCMRAHGISGLPDPKPNPPPAPGSPGTANIGTLMGDGGYWVGIPGSVNAHSGAFTRLSTACGESPGGHRG
ncbi:MAG TPA: hypothetical protein VG410_06035 [Solirubrobacteraceae bacterium]|nr:hypothetical protein [Solirubrobacteraceae bacterium]